MTSLRYTVSHTKSDATVNLLALFHNDVNLQKKTYRYFLKEKMKTSFYLHPNLLPNLVHVQHTFHGVEVHILIVSNHRQCLHYLIPSNHGHFQK